MGMFSFIEKALGLRTGATQAAKEAAAAGEDVLAQQTELQSEIASVYKPNITVGNDALARLSGDSSVYYDQALASPAYDYNIGVGEDAIARAQQATGGFRSGTTGVNLAQNSQSVLQSLVDQYKAQDQYLANYGANAANSYTNAASGILNEIGGTSSEIANIGINQAANKSNLTSSLVGLGTDIASLF